MTHSRFSRFRSIAANREGRISLLKKTHHITACAEDNKRCRIRKCEVRSELEVSENKREEKIADIFSVLDRTRLKSVDVKCGQHM